MGQECGDAASENGSVGRRCGLLECVNEEAFDLSCQIGGAWPEDGLLGRGVSCLGKSIVACCIC